MKISKVQRVEKGSDVKLDGITIEAEKSAHGFNRITLSDASGNSVTIASGSVYAGLEVTVPAAPTMKKAWKLTGTIAGVVFEETFDESYEASTRENALVAAGAVDTKVTEFERPEEI